MEQILHYDTVILGGGPAGCATALALRRRGRTSILVAEGSCYRSNRIGESIPPDTRVLLQRLGIWEEFLREEHDACLGSCSSWGEEELGYNDFLFNPFGNGWHLDRRRFDAFLARKTADSGVEVRTGIFFEHLERARDDDFHLRFSGSDMETAIVSARFVVDATGVRSRLARRLGVEKRFHDQLICVYGFFALPESIEFSRLTILESIEYGWWYVARLPDRRLAVAVASDSEIIRQFGLHKAHNWLARLQKTRHSAGLLAKCRFIDGSLRIYPAPSFLLDKVAGNGWLAVGDAASAYDPISSQGIYKSLSDGLQAADVIDAWFGGDRKKLSTYQSFVAARFDEYLQTRNFFYGMEKRWSTSPFWKRRLKRTALCKIGNAELTSH